MKYKGKLYGKIGNEFFDTGHTTDDYDELVSKVKENEGGLLKVLSCESTCSQSDWKEGGKCDINGCYHK